MLFWFYIKFLIILNLLAGWLFFFWKRLTIDFTHSFQSFFFPNNILESFNVTYTLLLNIHFLLFKSPLVHEKINFHRGLVSFICWLGSPGKESPKWAGLAHSIYLGFKVGYSPSRNRAHLLVSSVKSSTTQVGLYCWSTNLGLNV